MIFCFRKRIKVLCYFFLLKERGASPGIQLAMQGTPAPSLVREDSPCQLSPQATLLSKGAATTEARVPSTCAPQQEKPLQGKGALLPKTSESPRTAMGSHHSQ